VTFGDGSQSVGIGEGPRLVTFVFGQVVVHAAEPYRNSDGVPAFARWPCPGCGMRRLVDDVQVLDLADLPGDRNRRQIIVCPACATHVQQSVPFRISSGHDEHPADAS
jgi:hypothetical protein